jgi:hypothetical protein
MSRLFFLFSVFILAGCESDFQKCMNTELPRSVKAMKLDEVGNQLHVLDELKALAEKEDAFDSEFQKWAMANPFPKRPDEMDWFDFIETEVHLAHDAKASLAILQMSESLGFEEKTSEEVFARIELFQEKVDIALRPRAITFNCWGEGEDDCRSPLWEELFFLMDKGMEPRLGEVAINSLHEAKLMLAEKISKLSKQSMMLATVTCNTNGFYE